MRSRTRLLTLFLIASLCSLTACKHQQQNPGLIPITLQTDWYPQPEHGGFYDALLRGYYKDEGLDVRITPGGPFVSAENQVSGGAAQFAMGSSDQVLVAVARGLPVIAVEATMQQDPQALMLHKDSPVHSFTELNGQTIAVKPGSIWFQYLLKRYNLNSVREIPATYSVANFLQDPHYIQQCFVTSEPYFAAKSGADVRTMLISETGYQPYRVVFTASSFLHDHPELVAKFVRASLRGWRDYLGNSAVANTEISKLNPAMSPDQMQFSTQTLKDQHFITSPDPNQLGQFTFARWNTMYQQLLDLKVISTPIDPKTAYTTQFVDAAAHP
ncbi:ABC transporter substrate-binding protein [Granulicella sp. S190]|uniref:ABC transporter substrate-binding protein n=1 Tax=Granulicella sp. S190 TaxID=1747226 RepID=UPI00131C0FE7|nr:ABC transporter substrate-binding protein [Granulicella sp. S190]